MNEENLTLGAGQWPFLGIVVLLVLLILATPGLLGAGRPSAGSAATQAVLVVYRGTTVNLTEFHVEGVSLLAYHRISLGLATNVSAWPVPRGGTNLSWSRWVNGSDTLSVVGWSGANPVAVNVSAEFVDSTGATEFYVGVYAFNLTGATLLIQPLLPGLDSGTPSLSVSSLPVALPLLAHTGRSS